MDLLVHECRSSKLKFCLDKGIGMLYLDMSKLPLWKRALAKKEFVLWQSDIESMREFVKAYDQCKDVGVSFF